jgi:Protein of unknown function (DUF2796)
MNPSLLMGALSAVVWLLLSPAETAAGAQHAHVHGVASLQVAVDGERLALTFSSPLDNLVGFERAPRNAQEKAAFQDMMARLQRPEALFIPSPAARCVRASARIDSPLGAAQAAGASKPELTASAKQNAEKKGEVGEHAGLTAEIVFTCERPQDLDALNVAVFDAFPKLKRIDAQVAAKAKQTAAKLTPHNRQLAW